MEKNNNHPIQDLPLEEGQIIIYQPNETIKVEVKMEDETVWLTQIQMTELFQTSKQNVSLHINNIFKEGELEKEAVVKESLTTAKDGKKYKTKFYNLDVIISVGYRVKSIRGTRFRQWANSVLKDYLLHGYTFNKRIGLLEQRMLHAEEKIDFFVKTSLPPTEGIFFNGQIFDAYLFVTNLVKSAQTNITLLDNYIDESVLTLLDKRANYVTAKIYTHHITSQLQLDLDRHNAQYSSIEISEYRHSHDRFICIDDMVYHIGASIKDLGKKWFAFSKLNDITTTELLNKINRN